MTWADMGPHVTGPELRIDLRPDGFTVELDGPTRPGDIEKVADVAVALRRLREAIQEQLRKEST